MNLKMQPICIKPIRQCGCGVVALIIKGKRSLCTDQIPPNQGIRGSWSAQGCTLKARLPHFLKTNPKV